ncbi:MAG: hypothetical protein ACE5KA_05525 [Nitrososphaerales archaeon]
MPFYECNENQFVENIRRLIESEQHFVVNRKISIYDDHKYGLSIIPDQEFEKYSMICDRKGFRYTVYAKVPFVDDFRGRFYSEGQALHYASNLGYPAISIPYYKVEYSFNLWGSTYLHTFDGLFGPNIVIGKREIPQRTKRNIRVKKSTALIHVLKFNPPDEKMLSLNLPNQVIIFDIKKMARIFDV